MASQVRLGDEAGALVLVAVSTSASRSLFGDTIFAAQSITGGVVAV